MNTQTSTGEWLTIDEAVEATTRTKKAIMGWVYKHKVNAKKMADETWLIEEDSLLERHNATEQRRILADKLHQQKLNALDKPKPEIDFENFFRHALVLEMLRVSASLHMVQQIAEHVGNPEGCSATIIDFLKEMDLWVRQLQGQTYPFIGE